MRAPGQSREVQGEEVQTLPVGCVQSGGGRPWLDNAAQVIATEEQGT
jgi:hypothetical protein